MQVRVMANAIVKLPIYIYTEYEMSFIEDDDMDRILTGANYVEPDQVILDTGSMPELLGAVESPTGDTVSREGMAPREGSEGELQIGEWPSSCFSQVGEFIYVLISDMFSTTSVCDSKMLCAYKRVCTYK